MVSRLYELDGRPTPIPVGVDLLEALHREFPNRRAALDALADMEQDLVGPAFRERSA